MGVKVGPMKAGIRWRDLGSAVLCGALIAAPAVGVGDDQLDEIVDLRSQMHIAAARSQEKIDTLTSETQDLFSEYREANQEIDQLRVYIRQLEELVADQESEIASKEEQIDKVTQVERGIMPLMEDMLDSLEQFIRLDVPFLLEERTDRVARLRRLLGRADVTVAEKYRRLMEAYSIENDYGRKVGVYRGPHVVDGEERQADFLRIGRLILISRTPDEEFAEVWDQRERKWSSLDGEYRTDIRRALRMARDHEAFDLLHLPVSAPEAAK